MNKQLLKRISFYLLLSLVISFITVFYEKNNLNNISLIFECICYYLLIVFFNDLIIRWFYLKTNIPSAIKILINICVGLLLLIFGRFLSKPFEIYSILNFDLFIVILFPLLIIIDVNLDFHLRKSFEKFNISLRKYINKKQ